MPVLNLKPGQKSVKAYYESLDQFDRIGVTHEAAVRSAFQSASCVVREAVSVDART